MYRLSIGVCAQRRFNDLARTERQIRRNEDRREENRNGNARPRPRNSQSPATFTQSKISRIRSYTPPPYVISCTRASVCEERARGISYGDRYVIDGFTDDIMTRTLKNRFVFIFPTTSNDISNGWRRLRVARINRTRYLFREF